MSIRKSTLLLIGCLAVSLFCLAYPVYVIWPFRHQGPVELKVALAVLRFRLLPMCIACALALFAAAQIWRNSGWRWRRIPVAFAAILVLGFTGLSRINIYELMFHPMGRPDFIPASAMKLDGSEKLLAVRLGGEARAYPIRSISYHHVVNDRLGGVPIVATY